MADNGTDRVLLPMKVDAFVFNAAVCKGDVQDAKVAPITQPNYTFLRLDSELVQNDVLDPIYLGHASPESCNSRYTNLATGEPWPRRQGVYLHWILPRAYRSGKQHGQEDGAAAAGYPEVPTRWLVIRKLDMATVQPASAQDHVAAVDAWVIESDRRWELDDLDPGVDLQVDVSPFITGVGRDGVSIDEQAEVFIGCKMPAFGWKEAPEGQYARIQLSLLNSSNPLFPDYQPHNSNVFSMVDNLDYFDGTQWQTLSSATCHYYVLGWHSTPETDLFNTTCNHAHLLESLMMNLKSPDGESAWLDSDALTRSMCHGSIYNVQWDAAEKPASVPADAASRALMKDMSVAVGTTPMDALLSWVSASYSRDGGGKGIVHDLEETLLHIEKLLHARDDGVDARLEADDQLYNWNYSRFDGGAEFHLSTEADADSTATNGSKKEDRKILQLLNRTQVLIDLAARGLAQTRWELFATWWKVVSDNDADEDAYSGEVDGLLKRINKLEKVLADQQRATETLLDQASSPFKKGAHEPFHQQRDPSLLVGGIQSGWPYDFLDPLAVRLGSQTVPLSGELDKSWDDFVTKVLPSLPDCLQSAASGLVKEFAALLPVPGGASQSSLAESGGVAPLYHDQGWNPAADQDAPWRDRWNGEQPCFPLFIEWEAEYTHIPFEHWSLEERAARQSSTKKLRAGIVDGVILYDKKLHDKRVISGRSLILPQATYSLQAKIAQVLQNTPKSELEYLGINSEERKLLETSLGLLPFLSAPMAGFSDHLATRMQGTHVKPNNRTPETVGVTPIPAAARPEVLIDTSALAAMALQTDPTPYGFAADFRDGTGHAAFKPVVHGQFRFTRLNIIDKFGQAMHALDPTPRAGGPPPLYPCLSEYYQPQLVANTSDQANTVTKDSPGVCEYVQVAMNINQAARLNAAFVVPQEEERRTEAKATNYWRPVDPEENEVEGEDGGAGPIWGWVVLNNADNGLQFFLPDGTFYGEARFGGGTGGADIQWFPFGTPPSGPQVPTSLDRLIKKLQDVRYLQAFAGMLVAAQEKLPAPPSAYAQYLNALVGQPLALTTIGWSLELAENGRTSESSLEGDASSDMTLLGSAGTGQRYSFPMKLGDKDRAYDGLVGYFNAYATPKRGRELDIDSFYTYFDSRADANRPRPGSEDPLHMIAKDNYPQMQAFWLDPEAYYTQDSSSVGAMADQLAADRAAQLTVVGAIISPFTPVHASTSTLPVRALQLPPWTWQQAMDKMTAFFHLGPYIIPGDVPPFRWDYKLSPGTYDPSDDLGVPGSEVQVPTMSAASWYWLQPYWEPASTPLFGQQAPQGGTRRELQAEEIQVGGTLETGIGPVVRQETEYMALNPSAVVDGKPRFEKGPYTAIEGLLQLRTPLLKDVNRGNPAGGGTRTV